MSETKILSSHGVGVMAEMEARDKLEKRINKYVNDFGYEPVGSIDVSTDNPTLGPKTCTMAQTVRKE